MSTTTQLWLMLFEHDWTYEMSDDHSAYCRGRDQRDAIVRAAQESDDNMALYDAWIDMRREGGDFPPLHHKGCDVHREADSHEWLITYNGKVVDGDWSPRRCVELINENMMIVEQSVQFANAMDAMFKPLIDQMERNAPARKDNVIPFPGAEK